MPERATQPQPTLEPVSVPADAGDAWWWVGCLAVIKASTDKIALGAPIL